MDSTLPLISVIVPFYNVEAYLVRCLDSIMAQTYHNLEIVIINDGSSDRGPLIAGEYAKKDSRICLIHQANAGIAESRNVGMRISHGNYLSFIDSDDFIDPDYYEKLYKALNSQNADISICNKRMIHFNVVRPFEHDIPEGITILSGNEALIELVNEKWLRNYVWDKLFKKELFNGIEFPEGRTYEDVSVMHKIFYRAKKVVITKETNYNYRLRPNSIISSRSISNQYDCFLSHMERISFFENVNLRNLALKEIVATLNIARDTMLMAVFHYATCREKKYLRAMEEWCASYKNKLYLLPYHDASEAKIIHSFLVSRTLFMIRHAPKELFIRSKFSIKYLLPYKSVALIITVKSIIEKWRSSQS